MRTVEIDVNAIESVGHVRLELVCQTSICRSLSRNTIAFFGCSVIVGIEVLEILIEPYCVVPAIIFAYLCHIGPKVGADKEFCRILGLIAFIVEEIAELLGVAYFLVGVNVFTVVATMIVDVCTCRYQR